MQVRSGLTSRDIQFIRTRRIGESLGDPDGLAHPPTLSQPTNSDYQDKGFKVQMDIREHARLLRFLGGLHLGGLIYQQHSQQKMPTV